MLEELATPDEALELLTRAIAPSPPRCCATAA
jgi:hypothetical protein